MLPLIDIMCVWVMLPHPNVSPSPAYAPMIVPTPSLISCDTQLLTSNIHLPLEFILLLVGLLIQ